MCGLIYVGNCVLFWSLFVQHCFTCRPQDSTVSEDAGIEPRTFATSALAVKRSNHSVRSHPHTRLDLINKCMRDSLITKI
jgi:hypothetical protein